MIEYTSPKMSKRAKEILERDKKVMFGAHTRTDEIPLVVDHARGARVTDVDGKEYLDFGAGFAVVGTGHCHSEVIDAINDQVRKLIHISGSDFYYTAQIELAGLLEQLNKIDEFLQTYRHYAQLQAKKKSASAALDKANTRKDSIERRIQSLKKELEEQLVPFELTEPVQIRPIEWTKASAPEPGPSRRPSRTH